MDELTYEMILKSWKESAKISEASEDKKLDIQCKEMVEKAIEKQIGKIPTEIHKAMCPEDIEAYGEDALFGYCPCCNNLQSSVWNPENCGDCGQKLDWKDECFEMVNQIEE